MSEITEFIEKAIAQTPEKYHDMIRDNARTLWNMALDDAYAIAALAARRKYNEAWKKFLFVMDPDDRALLEKKNNTNFEGLLVSDKKRQDEIKNFFTGMNAMAWYLMSRPR